MSEIIGRVTCAVCGEGAQDLKVNKNNKLYCYCDNGCKWQLNSKESRAVLAALRQGKSVKLEKIGIIRPIAQAERDDLESELDI